MWCVGQKHWLLIDSELCAPIQYGGSIMFSNTAIVTVTFTVYPKKSSPSLQHV